MASKVRLFIDTPLALEQIIELSETQSHYLSNVMKLKLNDKFLGFDGKSGEYELQITQLAKKHLEAKVIQKQKSFQTPPDVWLLFAPVKKDQTDFIIQKAVELGVCKLIPTITRYTISDKTKTERFVAQSIEAAEQCRRVDIPQVLPAQSLSEILSNWDKTRPLYYMDESRTGLPVKDAFSAAPAPIALLVGPEGGFSKEELKLLRQLDFATGVTLGPRILRAETAVVAALSCWQALSGDWVNYKEQNECDF